MNLFSSPLDSLPAGSLTIVLVAALAGSAAHAQTESGKADPAIAKALAESGAVATESGLVYRSLKDGTGATPGAADVVRVHYRGMFPDGREFDSSYQRGKPAEFPLNRVIKCWTEGVQRMKVGGKARLACPSSVAYGERGAGAVIPPNATLLFEVELLGIVGK